MKPLIYRTEDRAGKIAYVQVKVDTQDDHFVSSSLPVDASGNVLNENGALAPKFYGMTPEQALRRMVDALENSFEDVQPATP